MRDTEQGDGEQRLQSQAQYRLQRLREQRLLGALFVESPEFWRLGEWLSAKEAAAAEQRVCGNMTRGNGQGGSSRCDNITGCQANVINVSAILRRLRDMMDGDPEGEYTIGTIKHGLTDWESLLVEN